MRCRPVSRTQYNPVSHQFKRRLMHSIEIEVRSWRESKTLLAYPKTEFKPSIAQPAWGIAAAGCLIDAKVKRCIFPISRSPRKLPAEDSWLEVVRRATKYAAEKSWTIVSSSDTIGWEYTTWYAANRKVPLWLVLPPMPLDKFQDECRQHIYRFGLDPEKTSFIMLLIESKLPKANCQYLRDALTIGVSHYRLPIHIRPRGNWTRMLSGLPNVDNRFASPRPQRYVERWRQDASWTKFDSNHDWENYLFHWTRGTYGPWPGETDADYFSALTSAEKGNPRDGLATLEFIVASGILRGEGRMIRKGTPVVSFTDLHPVELVKITKYRSSLKRWTCEPYGIAISRQTMQKLGARKVIYGDKDLFDQLPAQDHPYYQFRGKPGGYRSNGSQVTDGWEAEAEWRLVGDLDLTSIAEDVMIITPFASEAETLRKSLPYRVHSLEGGLA